MTVIQEKYYRDKAFSLFKEVFNNDKHQKLFFDGLKINRNASNRRNEGIQLHDLEIEGDSIRLILISSSNKLDRELYDKTNPDNRRFFDEWFEYGGRYYYFSDQWSGKQDAKGSHHIDNFIRIVNKVCNSNYQFIADKNNKSEYQENKGKSNLKNKEKLMPLNQILYGPPGTGKTYNTINKALQIIASVEAKTPEEKENKREINKALEDHTSQGREKVKKLYNKYVEAGQIEFVTFHQSYGYEEFVEGIKPILPEDETTNEGTLTYEMSKGIFQRLAWDKAYENYLSNKSSSFQLNIRSLLNDFSNYVEESLLLEKKLYITGSAQIAYIRKDTAGDFASFKTGGGVNGQSLTSKVIIRDLEKFLQGEIKSPDDIKPTQESQSHRHGNSIYYFALYEKIKKFINESGKNKYFTKSEALKNFVLIIDEINRGNISKIFGELITLIEPSKRLGSNEEDMMVRLPYSNELFGVPNNLYIIGTMNTADRSIAPIDTALRRRFVFEEMMPRPELLKNSLSDTEIDLELLLTAINARIEYLYDRDHLIGHSFFMKVDTLEDLKQVFEHEIIPLLAEYFYEDWENIDLVLNKNGFIAVKEENKQYLTEVKNKITGKENYSLTKSSDWTVFNFKEIYGGNKLEDDASKDNEDQ